MSLFFRFTPMFRFVLSFSICLLLLGATLASAQETNTVEKDSIPKKVSPFVSGYYPLGFFDFDLRYLIKYNNYEAFRLGIGGITNERLSERFKIGGYVAYGFKDDAYKYGLGGNYLLSEKSNTWLSLYYTKDIKEIGTFEYLTKSRVYSVFEPRLINITQFYGYRSWKVSAETDPSEKLSATFQIAHSNIDQIEDYQFLNDGVLLRDYKIAEAIIAVQYAPKTLSIISEDGVEEYYDGLPKISAQINQAFSGIAESNFNYTKAGLKFDYLVKRTDLSSSHFVLEGAMAFGDVPLTHLYHAYPNSPTKDEILQRFSVAGTQSFETMFFGEFFSSELVTFRAKHSLRRFKLSEKWKPELVFITRHALGNLDNREVHIGLPFNTLEELYSESGFELNKLLFGFGLSFAYRYGFYHLPKFEDNISFKFTFNLKI